MNGNVTGKGAAKTVVKKKALTFSTLQRLLSLDMKTKVVQHVESE